MSRTLPSDQPIETHAKAPDVDDTQPVEPPPGSPPGGDGDAVPVPPPPPTNFFKAIGQLDALIPTGVVRGWAFDPDVPNQAIAVRVYLDGPMGWDNLKGEVLANLPGKTGEGADRGFAWRIPDAFRDGQPHTLYVYAIDSSWLKKYSPLLGQLSFTLQPSNEPPVGTLELIKSVGAVSGWALDPNVGAPIQVSFYIDDPSRQSPPAGQVMANDPRPDVTFSTGLPGNHGFQWSIPTQFHDGMNHLLYAFATDTTTQSTVALSGAPKTFALPPSK